MSLRKAVPPNTLDQLLVPNRSFAYFEHWASNPFRHDAADYEPVNAWWLAEASWLAYARDMAMVGTVLRERAGLTSCTPITGKRGSITSSVGSTSRCASC